MAREFDPSAPLKPHTKVRSVIDLAGVPKFSNGKVEIANGITWLRYWVRFDNGELIGHVSHGDVIPVKHWPAYLVHKEQLDLEAAAAEARAAAAAESGTTDSGGGAAVSGDAPVVNGVTIPPHLIAASAAARIRLGAA